MKNIKVFILVLVCFLTAGCMNYQVEMGVNSDKSVDFSFTTSIDLSQYKDLLEEGESAEDSIKSEDVDFSKLEKRGYKVTEESNSDYDYKVVVTNKFNNINDISKEGNVSVDFSKFADDFDDIFFSVEKGLLKDKYTGHFVFESVDEETDLESMKMYKDMIDMTYTINLPNESISNNSTSQSNNGKTLTWDLLSLKDGVVDFSFELKSDKADLITYGGIAVLVIIILGIGFVIINKNKNNKKGLEVITKDEEMKKQDENNLMDINPALNGATTPSTVNEVENINPQSINNETVVSNENIDNNVLGNVTENVVENTEENISPVNMDTQEKQDDALSIFTTPPEQINEPVINIDNNIQEEKLIKIEDNNENNLNSNN